MTRPSRGRRGGGKKQPPSQVVGGGSGFGRRAMAMPTPTTDSRGRERQQPRRHRPCQPSSVLVVVVVTGLLLLLLLGPAVAVRTQDDKAPRSLRREEREQPDLASLAWKDWTREMGGLVRELQDAYQEGQMAETNEASPPPGSSMDVAFDGRIETMRTPVADALNAASVTPDRFFPFCPFVGAFDRLQLTCPVVTLAAQLLIRGPPQFNRVTNEYAFPPDPEGLRYPEPLVDLSERGTGQPVPFVIDPALVAAEKMTYAFYHRIVYNMYAYTYDYADVLLTSPAASDPTIKAAKVTVPPPLLPAGGWGNQQLYFIKDPKGWKWPIGQSMTRNDTMLVVFRGTIWPGSWATDLTYQYANLNETQARNLPGRVHKGWFNYSSQLFGPLERQLQRHPEVTRLVFTGHSMGGALSTILSVYFARNHRDRLQQIDVVALASPQVGDADFNCYADRHINMRRISFLGSAQRTDIDEPDPISYGFGDIVPSLPLPCAGMRMPVCRGLEFVHPTAEGIDHFTYTAAHGNVPFYFADMQNAAGWRRKEDFVLQANRLDDIPNGIYANHLCSYSCWFSSVTGDPEHHCYFPEDANSKGMPPEAICDLDWADNLVTRYPRLEGPPIDSDLVDEGHVVTQWPIVRSSLRRPLFGWRNRMGPAG